MSKSTAERHEFEPSIGNPLWCVKVVGSDPDVGYFMCGQPRDAEVHRCPKCGELLPCLCGQSTSAERYAYPHPDDPEPIAPWEEDGAEVHCHNGGYYSVLRYVPDLIRDEAINIGVVLEVNNKRYYRVTNDLTRAVACNPLITDFVFEQERIRANVRSIISVDKTIDRLVEDHCGGTIQATPKRFGYFDKPESDLEEIFQQFIVEAHQVGCPECGAHYYHSKSCPRHIAGAAFPVGAHALWCKLNPGHAGVCATGKAPEHEMSEPLNDSELDAIRKRVDAATTVGHVGHDIDADADFIAHSREDVERLLATVDQLKERVKELETTCEHKPSLNQLADGVLKQ